jgi:hypothetical protein
MSRLKPTQTIFLVNVPVSFLFLPVLEHHSNAKDEDDVDTNHPKGRSKNQIHVFVGKGGEWADAPALLQSDQISAADIISSIS